MSVFENVKPAYLLSGHTNVFIIVIKDEHYRYEPLVHSSRD